MKIFSTRLNILVIALVLQGCAPRYHDQDNLKVEPLDVDMQRKTAVSATIDEWRNSGVLAEAGKQYRIKAQGRWRIWGGCNFTGPDGVGLYGGLCVKNPLFPTMIEGYSHSALIAKIGEDGRPFIVGSELEFTARESGPLLLRVNDCQGCSSDNEGFVTVNIERGASVPKPTQIAQALIPPSETVQPAPQASPDAMPSVPSPHAGISTAILGHTLARRTALVIGNGNYTYSPLKNPVNDANAMAQTLKNMGFSVTIALDANQQQMEAAIDEFGRKLISGNQVGLFYYAGHGVQVDGENYLIPVDAVIKRQSDVRYKAVNVGQVLGAMGEATDNLNIVILDACRDNPLPRSFRGGSRGLARVEGPKGTIIGFATSPGSVASDGDGDNGLYTKHLLKNMQVRGLAIEQVFKKVLQGVNEETQGQQIPWTESSFTGDFAFMPAAAVSQQAPEAGSETQK